MLKGKGYSVEFRAYDDAAAYRFIANASDSVTIENEKVEYNFTKDYEAYVPYVNDLRHGERYSNSFEAYYDIQKISQMRKTLHSCRLWWNSMAESRLRSQV